MRDVARPPTDPTAPCPRREAANEEIYLFEEEEPRPVGATRAPALPRARRERSRLRQAFARGSPKTKNSGVGSACGRCGLPRHVSHVGHRARQSKALWAAVPRRSTAPA